MSRPEQSAAFAFPVATGSYYVRNAGAVHFCTPTGKRRIGAPPVVAFETALARWLRNYRHSA